MSPAAIALLTDLLHQPRTLLFSGCSLLTARSALESGWPMLLSLGETPAEPSSCSKDIPQVIPMWQGLFYTGLSRLVLFFSIVTQHTCYFLVINQAFEAQMLRMLSAASWVQDTAGEEPYRSQEPGRKVFHNIKEAILSCLLLPGQTAKPDQVAVGLVLPSFENSPRQRHGYCAKVNNSDGRKIVFLPLAGSFLAASCVYGLKNFPENNAKLWA